MTVRRETLWTTYGVSGHEYAREKGKKREQQNRIFILLFIMTPAMMNILSCTVLPLISVNHFNVFSSRVFRCACDKNNVTVRSSFMRKSHE